MAQITVIRVKNGFVITSQADDGASGDILVCPNLDKLPEMARIAFAQFNTAVAVKAAPRTTKQIVEDFEDEEE